MPKLRLPTPHTLLLIIAAFVAALTWMVPSGTYETLSYVNEEFMRMGRESQQSYPATQQTLDALDIQIPLEKFENGDIWKPISIPGTYQTVESNPQGIVEFLISPVKGIIQASDIIFFVLILGGLVGLMNYTGAFNSGIGWLAKIMRGREFGLIILVMILNALGGTTFGLGEETIAFYPILIPVFIAAGYDSLVALGAVFIGSSVGVMCSTTNPFSTIIASNTAGINWTSGLEFRIVMLVLALGISLLYVWRYARKIKKDPSKSLVDSAVFAVVDSEKSPPLTPRIVAMLTIFGASFILMIVGVSKFGWWFEEMSALFLVAAAIIGILGRLKERILVTEFIKGAGELLGVALIIGFARGVTVLMDDGLISDTLLYYASDLTTGMQPGIFANAMMFIYGGLSFFISSTSGLAVLSMPVMSPLADTVGVGREVVVNAYQFGAGLLFFISPTALILPSLAMAKVEYNTWLKFVLPLMGILLVLLMGGLTLFAYM